MTKPELSELGQARAQMETVIDEIRRVSGFEQFLAPATFDDVRAAATSSPLVYLAAAEPGGLALVVRGGGIQDVSLPDLTAEALRVTVKEYLRRLEAFRQGADDRRADELWAAWTEHLDEVARWLWHTVMEPVLAHLSGTGPDDPVALVPCGQLGLLPLHAAWTSDPTRPTGRRYAIDGATLTYTANARALSACRQAAAEIEVRRAVVVSDPRPLGGRAPLEAMLAMAAVVPADRGLQATYLSGTAATKADVLSAMTEAELVHLGCHGLADLDEPMLGRVLLGDGTLTLEEILRLRLRVRLAVLAACDTAAVGADLPDEVVSLPTGLVQAGAAGVVAAMWSCDELATALMLTEFYRRWDGRPPAVALAQAQRWLRDSTRDEIRLAWEAALDEQASWLPEVSGDALLTRLLLDPHGDREPRPWSGPETWAAFTYTGA